MFYLLLEAIIIKNTHWNQILYMSSRTSILCQKWLPPASRRASGPEVIKNTMLNSAEHEIINAQEYKISRNSPFSGSDHLRIILFLLINVKMPAVVGTLIFIGRKNFMLN